MHKIPTNVLLVDDDEINNFLSNELIKLQQPKAEIKSILYVDDALFYLQEMISKKQPLPDVILVDINMPDLNGWDFLREFEKMDPVAIENVKVYIYTSSIYYKDHERVKEFKSVIKLFTKPFTEEMINEIFEELKK